MVIYTCPKCNKIFGKKSNYITHTKKLISCNKNEILLNSVEQSIDTFKEKQITNINDSTHKLQCKYCKLNFSRHDSLGRHLKKYCKVINESSIINILTDENDALKSKIDFLKNQHIQLTHVVSELNEKNDGLQKKNYIITQKHFL